MAQTDQTPRPLFDTLASAIRTAIRHGTLLSDINKSRWALTYGPDLTEQDVEAAWIHELTKETNARECGEGK
jgi:hypothetical protein